MPAGGTWTAQNKRRPGVYINFNAIPAPSSALGSTGTIITTLPLDWGPEGELIALTGAELLNGASMEKVGCFYNDPESLPFRLALARCHQMLIYRADEDGEKAVATIAGTATVSAAVSLEAKYAGIGGNAVQVIVVADRPAAGKSTVYVLYKGSVKEQYVLDTAGQLNDVQSKWVQFTVATADVALKIPATAGTNLTGGTNGDVDYTTLLTGFQDAARLRNWSTLALPVKDTATVNAMLQFINNLREVDGKMVQMVLVSDQTATPPADSEAVIATFQGYTTVREEITPELFTLEIAGINAGTALGVSNTCAEIAGATGIINAVPDGLITDLLDAGWYTLSYRADGAVVIEQDINTLRTYSLDRPKEYSKNSVIRLLNQIAQEASLIFIRDFAGKVRSNKTGRDLFKSRMVTYFTAIQDMEAIINFIPDDITVLEGEQPEGIVMDVAIQPVDAMEKLYMTVNIIA